MRILSIHAHPDDAEFLAGGTLALLAAKGHHITIVTMTAGDCGSAVHSPEVIAATRRKEAAAAAALIGAEYACAEFGDLCIFNEDSSRRRVTEMLRWAKPDIVLTASPSDYHCDHEATSQLVRDAGFCCSTPNYSTHAHQPAAPLKGIPHVYFMDPIEGKDREGRTVTPDFFIDISSTLETKKKMLLCHESQRSWLQYQHGMDDYVANMERWSAERGKVAGMPFAEGFRQYTVHPYPTSNLLKELLA